MFLDRMEVEISINKYSVTNNSAISLRKLILVVSLSHLRRENHN